MIFSLIMVFLIVAIIGLCAFISDDAGSGLVWLIPFGIFLALLCVWHAHESTCQNENNVADCSGSIVFVPTIQDKTQ